MIDTTSESNSKSVISASFSNVAEGSGVQRLLTSRIRKSRGQTACRFSNSAADSIPAFTLPDKVIAFPQQPEHSGYLANVDSSESGLFPGSGGFLLCLHADTLFRGSWLVSGSLILSQNAQDVIFLDSNSL